MKRIAFLIVVVSMLACKKKSKQQSDVNNPVQSIPVNITVYPNDPLSFKIQSIGGWMYLTGGINGILLYRKSEMEFVAIERSSTYLPDNAKAKIIMMPDNFTLRDTVSDSRWQVFDGTVTKGPASWPLRLYGTVYDGSVLHIKN